MSNMGSSKKAPKTKSTLPHHHPASSGETGQDGKHFTNLFRNRGKRQRLLLLLSVFSIATIGIAVYLPVYYFPHQDIQARSLYARAESLYRQRDYAAALARYRELTENFPEHPLTVVSEMRIVDIHNYLQWLEEVQKEKSRRVYRLMEKTKQAFLNGNFLTPEHDNAISYIKEILELDPGHQEALKFKKIIVNYYKDEARTAKLSKNYREAKELYQTVLDITPDDTTVQEELAGLNVFQR